MFVSKDGCLFVSKKGASVSEAITNTEKNYATDLTKLSLSLIEMSLMKYVINNNRYPSSSEGLQALIVSPENKPYWGGPYIDEKHLTDQWDKKLAYKVSENEISIISAGPDGVFSTQDDVAKSIPQRAKVQSSLSL